MSPDLKCNDPVGRLEVVSILDRLNHDIFIPALIVSVCRQQITSHERKIMSLSAPLFIVYC